MKVLLLDAAFSARPIYDALVGAGHEVWVAGNREADPLARKAGDHWLRLDYSDVEVVRQEVQSLGIERLIPGCTDVSLMTCVAIGMTPDLVDSAEVNAQLSDKARFRAMCERLDLPSPRAIPLADFPRQGRYICKPVDAFSGRGITIFDGEDSQALERAVSAAESSSASGQYLLETCVEGQLYSLSAFLVSQKIAYDVCVIEGSSANPYAVDTSHVVHDLPPAALAELRQGLERMSMDLSLRDGLLHTQFILAGEDPYIVEVTRRCPGDLYSLLIEYSTGFPYAAAYAVAGLGPIAIPPAGEQRHILRHSVASTQGELYQALAFASPVPIKALFPLMPVGETLLPAQRNRAAVLFADYDSPAALAEAYALYMARAAYDLSG